MTEQLMTWTNYGDVNPIEHGGMFVAADRSSSSSERQFYVIQVIPVEGSEESWRVYDGLIDLEDSWIEWAAVKETMDTPEGSEGEYLATDVMLYYGVHTGCSELEFGNRKELVEYLQNNGIEVEE